ncbi:exonuclease domain-containing protein [Actinoallomurus soli]|uniref:exonuclease domain-containing protein n=1 Tax=Actinoallomurus soli TaxID=2952535 RepID=UPI002091FAC4|nr:exonuclease domain-containing protein [Actinoallomurus soli]MCO5971753.1 exonuclease domain-containing protein [Actinoallomurus soli]
MQGYAVVDVETTGLYAGGTDRVIEAAVVHVDPFGTVTGEWATLVNPQRDLGPTGIHGIRAIDVRQAPSFAAIAPTLARLLARRVTVAHNLPFDARFLAAEYARLGVTPPLDHRSGLCTMRMAAEFLPGSKRALAACCQAAGVPLENRHDALSDARAAAGLLSCYLGKVGTPPPWTDLLWRALAMPWPALPPVDVAPVRRGCASAVPNDFLARLAERLPRSSDAVVDSYLALLDEALLDRYISVTEAERLVAVAHDLGIDRASALAAHRLYLRTLAEAAWADGELTPEELGDIREVAALLGLDDSDVSDALEEGRTSPGAREGTTRFRLRPGDVVVFTGEMSEPRDVFERRAEAAGLVIGSGVTKKTALVVAADPESLSGKARKASTYGIPIVAESAFDTLLADLF